jgi:chromosome partitioning protein
VIIDCPPALDVLTNNAIAASNGILVPVQPDRTSIRALRLLHDQIQYVEQMVNRPPITYFGIVPGLYRRPISHYAMAALNELHTFNIPVLNHLPLGVVMNEAAARGIPVTTYAPETVQAESFRQIAGTLEHYREHQTGGPIVPEEEFVFENFITEVSKARTANDNGARKKLYDFMPKRPQNGI